MNRKIASIRRLLMLAVGILLLTPSAGRADSVTFTTGSGATIQGQPVSASAVFSLDSNGNLVVVLKNTASSTNAMSQVLTNIDFNLRDASGNVVPLTYGSVTTAAGSLYNNTVQDPTTTNVSGAYVFGTNVTA